MDKRTTKTMKKKKQVGSYTDFFSSKMKYHGKGTKKRAKYSGNKIEKENDDKLIKINWTKSKNDRESFKDEHKRIMKDEGEHLNDMSYNKITSPGKKYMIEDSDLEK